MPNWLPANSGATVTTVTLTDVEITLKIMFVYWSLVASLLSSLPVS